MLRVKGLIGAIGFGLIAATAQAQQIEVLAIGNISDTDTNYLSFSVRRAFDGSLNNGAKFRFDISRANFDFMVGGVPSTGMILNTRALIGSAWQDGDTNITWYFGLSYEDRSTSPATGAIPDTQKWGVFASAEISHDFNSGANVFGLVEFESPSAKIYNSIYYVYPVGRRVKIGPTVNFISERTYERRAAGVRATIAIGTNNELTATGLFTQGGPPGGPKLDSSIFELQFRGLF